MRGLGETVEIVAAPAEDAAYDYCVTLCSLPRAFGTRADDDTGRRLSPRRAGARRAVARASLRRRIEGRRRLARQRAFALRPCARRAALGLRAARRASPACGSISLQKNFGAEQLRARRRCASCPSATDFDAGADAFVDTAAVIENLDLVVTIDTSIAHLAGALGKPVWIAIKHAPEWRWQLEREDRPWYHSARLFRQSARGDWGDVFARMAQS